jgi:ATP-binding cassette subfamily B (MDR/TAP) protein 1
LKLDTDTEESRGLLRPEIAGPIRFSHVGFSYPGRPDAPVLKDINLQIEPGECIAIVGPSGSGKSTLAALLQRLYLPDAGSISIGTTDLSSMDITHLRHHISVVSQSPDLFDATIAENIRYGNEGVSGADVREAAEAANVHEFVMSLPQGYDTVLGENAGLVSGGQAQRLQIARALARPATRVLILDECTSALDGGNQAAVLESVRGRKRPMTTTVMVTHKVQVMRMCDRVVLVCEGVVREEGSYEELMARKGLFAALACGGEWVGE